MLINTKNNDRLSEIKEKYKKVLNKRDPFDQLIIELNQKGVLDVCLVGIRESPSIPAGRQFSRKQIFSRE